MRLFVLHLGQPRHFFVRVLVRLPRRLLFITVRYQESRELYSALFDLVMEVMVSIWRAAIQVYVRNFQ